MLKNTEISLTKGKVKSHKQFLHLRHDFKLFLYKFYVIIPKTPNIFSNILFCILEEYQRNVYNHLIQNRTQEIRMMRNYSISLYFVK